MNNNNYSFISKLIQLKQFYPAHAKEEMNSTNMLKDT